MFFTIYGHGVHVGHVTQAFEQLFVPKGPGGCIKSVFRREVI